MNDAGDGTGGIINQFGQRMVQAAAEMREEWDDFLARRGPSGRGGIWQSRSGIMMIGGSVTGLSGSGTLTVTSPNGQKTPVVIPSTARFSRLASMQVSNLTVGTRVLVRGMSNPDGSVTASAVFVAGTASK